MVDVSDKPVSFREAVAEGVIKMCPETVRLIDSDGIAKGNVLAVARVAGIQAAKQTPLLIPLCHQLPLSKVAIDFSVGEVGVHITCTAKTAAQTGVEMEALTGVSVAALTIYDMCKAVDSRMSIDAVRLVSKTKDPA
jgi:cyclic pyranopterin phosphate synthase